MDSRWFRSTQAVRDLRQGFCSEHVDNRIVVFDSGHMTEVAIHFDPRGRFVAPDTPDHAMRAYGTEKTGPLLARGYGGGGLIDIPHVLPYAADRVIPWRLDGQPHVLDSPIERQEEAVLKPPMGLVREYFGQRRGAPRFDNSLLVMRGAKKGKGGALSLSAGVARYSDKRDTQEVDGELIAINDTQRATLREKNPDNAAHVEDLEARLVHQYPDARFVRDIVAKTYGGLPPWSGCYHFALGVATVIVTDDGAFPVSVRKAGAVSVNVGLNVPASGGIEAALWAGKWDRPAYELIALGMKNEIQRELGLPDGSYDLRIAGFLRELTRGGSPEFLCAAFFHGSLAEFLRLVVDNKDPERKELSGEMRAFLVAEVLSAFERGPELSTRFHHKLMANIAVAYPLLDRWLRNRSI